MKGWALRLFSYAVVFNFFAFCAVALIFGDALTGKIVDGRYYLGNHGYLYRGQPRHFHL
jgi:hypothetical protein